MLFQVDLSNPTLEFAQTFDPTIAAQYGRTDSISYLMHTLSQWLGLSDGIITLPLMFLFNFLMSWILVYFIYYKINGRKEYYVTFMLFNNSMFFLLWLMQILDIQTGFVLGLFAIFGMIRYRTETVPIREMTYLFIIIAQSVINSLSLHAEDLVWYQLLFANIILILLPLFFELWSRRNRSTSKIILYEKIENIVPERRAELLADIEQRTGIKATYIEIGHIDFLRDIAYIKVHYLLQGGETNTIGHMTKFKQG